MKDFDLSRLKPIVSELTIGSKFSTIPVERKFKFSILNLHLGHVFLAVEIKGKWFALLVSFCLKFYEKKELGTTSGQHTAAYSG